MTAAASRTSRVACAIGLLLMLVAAVPAWAQRATNVADTGVLVVTPDRGFLGNQEVKDAFDAFAKGRNAALVYVTDQRSEKILDQRLAQLADRGATRVEVLPLVMSTADARWQLAVGWLKTRQQRGTQLAIAKPYGASYLAVEDLSARLRDVQGRQTRLLLLGYGAASADAARAMRDELKRMGGFASTLAPDAISAVVYPLRSAPDAAALRAQFDTAIAGASNAVVVPVAFAPRADAMMDFSNWYADKLPANAHAVGSHVATTDALAQWMRRASIEAGMQFAPLSAADVGVVVLAHGADWFWNHEMEQALAPVVAKYKVAFAFSMADRTVVERAVRQLEKRDVRAIVVVRVFGMASSFLPSVRRMIGADLRSDAAPTHGAHMMMGGHGMPGAMAMGHTLAAAPRIRSALPMVTVGGVESAPLFAKALLENARKVSKRPARETVILVAHGSGNDATNARWMKLLDTLAGEIRSDGGTQFRAIRYATWREDWPDKRKASVEHVRELVQQAGRDGGIALIVPARTNEHGNAARYLKGLHYRLSKRGFAQTPYFAQWFEREIKRGVAKLAAPEHTTSRLAGGAAQPVPHELAQ